MRDTLIEFMDELRDYVAESGTNIAHDERDSSDFVDIFLNKRQTLLIDSVVVPKGTLSNLDEAIKEAIKKAKPNMDKIKDVDKHIDSIR